MDDFQLSSILLINMSMILLVCSRIFRNYHLKLLLELGSNCFMLISCIFLPLYLAILLSLWTFIFTVWNSVIFIYFIISKDLKRKNKVKISPFPVKKEFFKIAPLLAPEEFFKIYPLLSQIKIHQKFRV